MDCLEIISVRLARKEDFEQIVHLCREVLTKGISCHFKIYQSIDYETDLSVHILGPIGAYSHQKSLLGEWIRRILIDYGLVNHTLWTDLQENTAKANPAAG